MAREPEPGPRITRVSAVVGHPHNRNVRVQRLQIGTGAPEERLRPKRPDAGLLLSFMRLSRRTREGPSRQCASADKRAEKCPPLHRAAYV
jgi:hypothetical protein